MQFTEDLGESIQTNFYIFSFILNFFDQVDFSDKNILEKFVQVLFKKEEKDVFPEYLIPEQKTTEKFQDRIQSELQNKFYQTKQDIKMEKFESQENPIEKFNEKTKRQIDFLEFNKFVLRLFVIRTLIRIDSDQLSNKLIKEFIKDLMSHLQGFLQINCSSVFFEESKDKEFAHKKEEVKISRSRYKIWEKFKLTEKGEEYFIEESQENYIVEKVFEIIREVFFYVKNNDEQQISLQDYERFEAVSGFQLIDDFLVVKNVFGKIKIINSFD